jgi:predicted ATP-dependent protease
LDLKYGEKYLEAFKSTYEVYKVLNEELGQVLALAVVLVCKSQHTHNYLCKSLSLTFKKVIFIIQMNVFN